MRVTRWLAQILSLVVLLHSPMGATANTPVLKSVSVDLIKVKFNSKAIKAFTSGAKVVFPEESESQAVPVSDRIFPDQETPDWRLTLPDGTTIDWGYKYQKTALESVIVYDHTGRPRLLAAASYMPEIIDRGDSTLRMITPVQYQRALNDKETMVTVFVRDKRDLDVYLPYLNRWLQADLLGMNVDCTTPGMAQACRFADEVTVPTRAYLLANKRKPQPLAIPRVKAADIPLGAFTQ